MKKASSFQRFKKQKAFSLLEIMLVIAITLIAVTGVYFMMGKSQVSASIEMEQKNFDALSQGIRGTFASDGLYSGLTTELVSRSNITGIKRTSDGNLISSYNTPIVVRPAMVRSADDAFDIEYQSLDTQKCLGLVRNLHFKSFDVLIEGASSQNTTGNKEGSLAEDSTIINRCSSSQFVNNNGSVAFRFYSINTGGSTIVLDACTCTPETQLQSLACPAGSVGSVDQRRGSTCTGGTPDCATAVWSGWTTIGNTCAPVTSSPNPCPPGGCISPPPGVCSPSMETKVDVCPAGQEGGISSIRTSTCASATAQPLWGSWATNSNTCQPITAPSAVCQTDTQARYIACPAGQGGQIIEERQASCATSSSSPVWQGWRVISNTCSTSCDRNIASGTGSCCRVSTEEETRVSNGSCSAGQYGSIVSDEERDRVSTCSSSDTIPVWSSWSSWRVINSSGFCNVCPASNASAGVETSWVSQSSGCASGESGAIIWEAEMSRTRSSSYNCPIGTTGLPAPTFSPWSDWNATGNKRAEVSTCVVSPPVTYGWDFEVIRPHSGGTQADRTMFTVISSNGLETVAQSCFSNPLPGELYTWRSGWGWMPGLLYGKAGCECNSSREGWYVSWNQSEYFASDEDYQIICRAR